MQVLRCVIKEALEQSKVRRFRNLEELFLAITKHKSVIYLKGRDDLIKHFIELLENKKYYQPIYEFVDSLSNQDCECLVTTDKYGYYHCHFFKTNTEAIKYQRKEYKEDFIKDDKDLMIFEALKNRYFMARYNIEKLTINGVEVSVIEHDYKKYYTIAESDILKPYNYDFFYREYNKILQNENSENHKED